MQALHCCSVYLMGLDGGTIPTRTDILRGASWSLANTSAGGGSNRSTRGGNFGGTSTGRNQLDQTTQIASDHGRAARWESCALSGRVIEEDLQRDGQVFMCRLGYIYVKEALLEFILGTVRCPDMPSQRLTGFQGAFSRSKQRFIPQFGHLRSMKKARPCRLKGRGLTVGAGRL